MKKLLFYLIPFLILILVSSCTETPTDIPSGAEDNYSNDIHELYLMKSKGRNMDMSFEEFKVFYEKLEKQRRMNKNAPDVVTITELDWFDGYTEDDNLDMVDDLEVGVPIPFTFTYFGLPYNEIYVSSNGVLVFEDNFTAANSFDLPPRNGDPIIDVLAGDFNPSFIGAVYANIVGDAPNRVFIATWDGIPVWGTTEPNTFQVKLFEDGKIQFGFNGLTTDGYDAWPEGMEVGLGGDASTAVIVSVGDTLTNPIPAPGGGTTPATLDGQNICFTPNGPTYDWKYGTCADPEPDTEPDPVDEPYVGIYDARTDLEVLLAGDLIEKKLKKAVKNAIKDIDKSLDPKNWLDDLSGPDLKKGKKIFDNLKKAVKDLKKFRKAKGASLDQKLEVERIIMSLVNICRDFAQDALDVLEPLYCSTGKCGKEREKALKDMAKAEEELAKDHWDHAIDKYKKAWEHAVKALKHYENP